MSARGRNTRLIGSSAGVELRPLVEQAPRGLLAAGHEVGLDAPLAQRGAVTPADGGDLEPGERAGVQAELVELLADGAHGVDRGEADPLVAAGHQALDGALHLLRRARRLDGDRRHDRRAGAVARRAGSTIEPAWSLVRGTRTSQPNSGLVSNHDSVLAQRDGRAHDGQRRESDPAVAEHGLDLPEGRDVGALAGRRAALGDGDGRRRVAAGGEQVAQGWTEPLGGAEDDDGAAAVDRPGPVVRAVPDADDVHAAGLLRRQRARRHTSARR